MRSYITLFLALLLVMPILYAQNAPLLPVLHFNQQILPNNQSIEQLIGPYKSYVITGQSDSIPKYVFNNTPIFPTFPVEPLYNVKADIEKYPFSLGNIRFIEALLAQGYYLQTYAWLGEQSKPFAGMDCVLKGYNIDKQHFIGERANGKPVYFPYENVAENFQFAMLATDKMPIYIWKFTLTNHDGSYCVKAQTLNQALVNLSKHIDLSKNRNFLVYVFPETLGTRSGEVKIRVPFVLEYKKRKSSSAGCGGFMWVPVGCKNWDDMDWNPTWGEFKYIDPTMGAEFPTSYKNYVHNKVWQCHPCSQSYIVPGVGLSSRVDDAGVHVRTIMWTTCNVAEDTNYDSYGNATAVVKGVVNCWAKPPASQILAVEDSSKMLEMPANIQSDTVKKIFYVSLPSQEASIEYSHYTLTSQSPNIVWCNVSYEELNKNTGEVTLSCSVLTEKPNDTWNIDVTLYFKNTK